MNECHLKEVSKDESLQQFKITMTMIVAVATLFLVLIVNIIVSDMYDMLRKAISPLINQKRQEVQE